MVVGIKQVAKKKKKRKKHHVTFVSSRNRFADSSTNIETVRFAKIFPNTWILSTILLIILYCVQVSIKILFY